MFELPAELEALGAPELDALLAAVRDEAAAIVTALSSPETADSADLDRLEVLAGHTETIEAALATLAAATAARLERAATLSAKFSKPEPVVEAPVEVVPEVVVDAPVVAAAPLEGKVVAHPAAKTVAALAPKAKAPVATEPVREVSIVAAVGVPGLRGGQTTTLADLIKPALARWGSYENARGGQIQDELFKLVSPERDARLVVNGRNDQEVMKFATDQHRLKNASTGATGLIAAGGWCAPAEQRFDIPTLAALDGIWDGPTIAMPRGSISYFRQLDYSVVNTDLTASGMFTYTNSQLVATPPVVKPCFEIPCASPVQATLDARGMCLRAGILAQKAFPELIEAWLGLAMIAFAHFLNAHNLAEIVAGSTAVTMPQTFGAVASLLEAIDIQAMAYRYENGMAADAVLETVFPFWVPAVLRADHSKRQFIDADAGGSTYTEADFVADLAERGIRAQFVKDLYDANFTNADPTQVTEWPENVKFLMYSPGAWVRGTEDIISVSTLYDSTLLQTNRVQLLFVEAGTKMLPWNGPSRYITVPVCPSGATSGPIASVPGTYTCPES